MPEHNQITYGTSILRAYPKVLGLDPNEPGISRLSESLIGIVDLWSAPEFFFPRGDVLWATFGGNTAVAGEFGMVAISNPSTTKIVVVESATVIQQNAAGNAYATGFSTDTLLAATLGTAGVVAVDRRHGPSTVQTVIRIGTDPTFPFSTRNEQIRTPVNEPFSFINTFPCVLGPGDGVWVQAATANTVMEVNFRGRERPSFPGELKS